MNYLIAIAAAFILVNPSAVHAQKQLAGNTSDQAVSSKAAGATAARTGPLTRYADGSSAKSETYPQMGPPTRGDWTNGQDSNGLADRPTHAMRRGQQRSGPRLPKWVPQHGTHLVQLLGL